MLAGPYFTMPLPSCTTSTLWRPVRTAWRAASAWARRSDSGPQPCQVACSPAAPVDEGAAEIEPNAEAHAVDFEAKVARDLRPGRALEIGVFEPVDLARIGDQVPDIRRQARVDDDAKLGRERVHVLRSGSARSPTRPVRPLFR